MSGDPFGWLVVMLTEAWGEPKVQPPAEPGGLRAYREEDGLIWVRLADYSRRAFVWFPGGINHNLAIDKGAVWKIRMGGLFTHAELETRNGTWAGLTRERVEPVARWVYGLPGGDAGHEHCEVTLETMRDLARRSLDYRGATAHGLGYYRAMMDVQAILDKHGAPADEPVIFGEPS